MAKGNQAAKGDQFGTLTPEFLIYIKDLNHPVDTISADMISLNVLDDVDAPSMAALMLSAWNSVDVKPKWIDDDMFREGNPMKIEMGYRDQKVSVFNGEITGLEPYFGEMRAPTLTVRGYDRRHRLMRQRKTKSFINLKDSDIASQVAQQANLKPQVEDSKVKLPYVLQHNQTDLEFLLARARRINYEVVVQDKVLSFRSRKINTAAKLTLRRDIELLEFRPRMTTMNQAQEYIVRGWSPKDKKEIVGRSAAGDESTVMEGHASGPANVQQHFSSTGTTRVTAPVQSQEEADHMAKQGFSEMALSYIRAEGVCIGDPRLQPGTVVKIEGLGTRFSGLYYIYSTEHRFSMQKGYRTTFSARRNAT
jgi:phage protein D